MIQTKSDSYQTHSTKLAHASRDRRNRVETDSGEFEYVPTFPSRSPARTTFHNLPTKFWKLQHGRGHTYDDRGKTTVRNDYTGIRCKTILQQCEFPEWARKEAVNRIFKENLQGFSRHYAGSDGACIAFALLCMHDSSSSAKNGYRAKRAAEVIPGLNSDDIDNLIEHAFRKYGGES